MALPDMIVEKRESTTAHTVPQPNLTEEYLNKDLQDTMFLNKHGRSKKRHPRVLEILSENIPWNPTGEEMKEAVKEVTGHRSWGEVSTFVVDDACTEFFNMCLKYCLRTGQKIKNHETGVFIEASGTGFVNMYTDRLDGDNDDGTLQKAFDAKYFYKVKRPLEYMLDKGFDISESANAIHPGHWSYPAGHWTKFLTAVEIMRQEFELDEDVNKNLFIAACVESHGRSGNLIHFLQDNLAAWSLTTLVEFNS